LGFQKQILQIYEQQTILSALISRAAIDSGNA